MNRRVRASIDAIADDAGFAVAPEAAPNRRMVILDNELQAVARKQGFDRGTRYIGKHDNCCCFGNQVTTTMRAALKRFGLGHQR